MSMIRWTLVLVGLVLLVGMMAYARGTKHHHGIYVGSHGTKVVLVTKH